MKLLNSGHSCQVSSAKMPSSITSAYWYRRPLCHCRTTPASCPTAPAEPLTLWDVGYPNELDPFTTAERQSFAWPDVHARKLNFSR